METWERMAKQAGGEAKANREHRHMTKADREDIAAYHPAQTWNAMPEDDQNRAMDIFQAAYDGKSV